MEHFEGKSSRPDFRRTFKLVLLKDVGPGWQIARARDLYPVWVDPKRAAAAASLQRRAESSSASPIR